jgi:hypothetical protein
LEIIISTILSLNSLMVFGQKDDLDSCISQLDTLTRIEVYTDVDQMPTVDGGMQAIYYEISKSIKLPNNFEKYSLEGKTYVAFIVTEEGNIIGQRVIKNVEGTDFAEQLLLIIDKFKWYPGICDEKPVPTILILPMIIDVK